MVKIHTTDSNGDKGEDTNTNESLNDLYNKLVGETHSYRNYSAKQFKHLLEGGFDKAKIRKLLKSIEAGRFYSMLESTFKFYIPLDSDERQDFIDANRELMEWVDVYAKSEDLMPPSQQANVWE